MADKFWETSDGLIRVNDSDEIVLQEDECCCDAPTGCECIDGCEAELTISGALNRASCDECEEWNDTYLSGSLTCCSEKLITAPSPVNCLGGCGIYLTICDTSPYITVDVRCSILVRTIWQSTNPAHLTTLCGGGTVSLTPSYQTFNTNPCFLEDDPSGPDTVGLGTVDITLTCP